MKIHTIPKKQSGTGSIHDLPSQHYDRMIKFRGDSKYAVVLAAYYVEKSGTSGYTTHKTEASAIRQARKLREYSLQIIDPSGNRYETPDGQMLVKIS